MHLRKFILMSLLGIGLVFTSLQTVSAQSFTDVSKDHWAFESINKMRNQKVIEGYPDGSFKPNRNIERRHVALLFTKILDLENVIGPVQFKDVSEKDLYVEEIQQVVRAGIFRGSNGYFRPSENLTRAQMATILTIAFDLEVKASYDFVDVPEGHWANESVRALYSNGITVGSEGKFKPNDPVTRAQYAAFLNAALNLDKEFVVQPIIPSEAEEPLEPPVLEANQFEQQVAELTNNERSKHGLAPLQVDVLLGKVAHEKSRDMAINNYFSHDSPIYGSLFDMMKANGISYSAAGENIAKGYFTPEHVVTGWMNSPGHRQNILNDEFTHIGVGFFEQGNLWTQMFIRK